MKKMLLVSFISFWLTATINAGDTAQLLTIRFKTDTIPTAELTNFLQQMNIPSFYGKPVDSFLLAIPANQYNLKIYPTAYSKGGSCRAQSLVADFVPVSGTGPGVIIYVNEFSFMNSFSPSCSWDISLFRKEKIYKIEVWKNQNVCINGSCLQ